MPNKPLAIALVIGIALAAAQYIVCTPSLRVAYALNVFVSCVISLVLFYTHTWAGGDCKLACVIALLYPAQAYLSYEGMQITLPLAIAFAFILGVCFLLISATADIMRNRPAFSLRSIGSTFLSFAQRFVCALSCASAIYLVNVWLLEPYISLSPLVLAVICFCVIWLLSNSSLLKNKMFMFAMIAFDTVLALLLHSAPLGASPFRYLFVLFVLLVRAIVSQQNYLTIPTSEVAEGMVLSTAVSMLFVGSNIKGLPTISTEDLKSRLTEEEASSVRRWGETKNGLEYVQVVRKMPFAVFVTLGFFAYFLLWSVA